MPSFCPDCGAYVEHGRRCAVHAAEYASRQSALRSRDELRRTRRRIYSDPRWEQARRRAIARAHGCCEADGCDEERDLTVHHLDYARPFDVTSLVVLCRAHHGRLDGARRRRNPGGRFFGGGGGDPRGSSSQTDSPSGPVFPAGADPSTSSSGPVFSGDAA